MVELSEIGERKRSNALKSIQFMGLFIIMLVLTMPFYSANAMAASVSVTKNTGTDGVEGYIDAEGDTWSLEVEITSDEEDIQPEQVILEVSGSQIEFNSCSSSSLSSTCEFQSVLSNGITEGTYAFEVILFDLETDPDDENATELGSELASDTDSVIADGSEPSISFTSAYQEDGDLYLDFTVEDEPNSCVGLDTVEVIDAETGTVYETFTVGEINSCDFDYVNDGGTAGIFSVELEGEEKRYFKIRATDLMGHEETTASKAFDTDFVAPVVDTSSLLIADFGDYISEYSQSSDILLNVTECNDLESVTATSDDIEFLSQEAYCTIEDVDECIHECTWNDITINPSGTSVSASVTAIDEAGNEVTSTASSSFTTDSTGPSVVYFGTLATYDDLSYVAVGEQVTIYAFIDESAAGIDETTVIANLAGVGGSSEDYPNGCLEDTSGTADYYCYWDITASGSSGSTSSTEINIHYLEDMVGNAGESLAIPIVVDGKGPVVYGIEFYGFSAVGQKDYFQSNDDLIIELEVYESSGLLVYVDANEIVMDAQSKYVYGTYDDDNNYVASKYDGWAVFDESSCERDEDTSNWDCEFSVDSIKSGPDSSADIEIDLFDTGGNEADWTMRESEGFSESQNTLEGKDRYDGEFAIEIFALDEETQPDFWEQASVDYNDDFVDLDIAEVNYERMNVNVKLNTDSNAEAALIELSECSSEVEGAPTLYRSLLLGGTSSELISNPSLDIILEYEVFDSNDVVDLSGMSLQDTFESKEIEYKCTLHVYSVVDDTAMNYAESQEITLQIPFRFSTVGALDENVDALISAHMDQTGFKILNVLSKISKILKYIQYLFTLIRVLDSLIDMINVIFPAADILQKPPQTKAAGDAACYGGASVVGGIGETMGQIMNGLSVFFCNEVPAGTSAAASYQQGVLNVWKGWKGDWLNAWFSKGGSVSSGKGSFGATEYNIASPGAEARGDLISNNLNTASLYDNVYIATIGICVPGIFYNLEKLRQVHCSKLTCLQDEVSAGVATIASCQERFDYGICKFVKGEILSMLIPMTGLMEGIGSVAKSIVSDPIGLGMFALLLLCPSNCWWSALGVPVCNGVRMFVDMVQTANTIASAIAGFKSIGYDQCAAAGITKDVYGEATEDEAESVTSDDLTGGSDDSSGEATA